MIPRLMRLTSADWIKNKHANKKLNAGRGTVGKTAVVGLRGRGTGDVKAVPVAIPHTVDNLIFLNH